MNKLKKIQLIKNINSMKQAASESETALTVAAVKINDSSDFNAADLQAINDIKRFVIDMNRFLGIIHQELQK